MCVTADGRIRDAGLDAGIGGVARTHPCSGVAKLNDAATRTTRAGLPKVCPKGGQGIDTAGCDGRERGLRTKRWSSNSCPKERRSPSLNATPPRPYVTPNYPKINQVPLFFPRELIFGTPSKNLAWQRASVIEIRLPSGPRGRCTLTQP